MERPALRRLLADIGISLRITFKASMQRTTTRTADIIKKTQERVMAKLQRFNRPEPRVRSLLLTELADLADDAEQALNLSAARKDAALRKIAKRLRSYDKRG